MSLNVRQLEEEILTSKRWQRDSVRFENEADKGGKLD